MTDSWRQPRRLLLLALGGLTVFFLMAPTLVVVPMSFTASNSLTFPPEGFSTRWYEKMLTDPQWSTGFVHSAQVAFLTAILATSLGTLAALDRTWAFPGQGRHQRADPVPADRPGDHHRDRDVLGLRSLEDRRLPGRPGPGPHGACGAVRRGERGDEPADDRPKPGAGGPESGRRANPDVPPDHPAVILPGVLAGGLFAFITSWDEVVVAIFLTSARFRTLPVEMWEQVRQVVDPTVAAVATTLLAVTTILLLLTVVARRQAPAR